MRTFLKLLLFFLISGFLLAQNYYVSIFDVSGGGFKEYGLLSLSNKKIALSSLYKIFLSYYLLEKGVIDEETLFNCSKSNECKCWDKRGHGEVNVVKAISLSCNRFFCHFRKDLNIRDYYRFIRGIFTLKKFNESEFERYFLEGDYSYIYSLTPQEIQKCVTSFLLNRDVSSGISLNLNKKYLKIVKDGMKGCYLWGTGKNAYKILGKKEIYLKTGTYKKRAGKGFYYKNLCYGLFKFRESYFSIIVFSLSGNSMENSVKILAEYLKRFEDEN